MPATAATTLPNDLAAYWMPFTANRAFKRRPRMIVGAKDMHYVSDDGRQVMDATAGLWCCNAGHARRPIIEAIQKQAEELDFAPNFQYGHPKVFALAARIAAMAPGDLDHVFFCGGGSEAVDSALKIALAYWNVTGKGSKTRLIGRERGYHGVGFGGISVGGMVNNRKMFGTLLTGVDHLPTTYDREKMAFSKGEPEWGAHLADELERIVGIHGPGTVAAVIVEPMAGSTGVVVTPKGYLQRLREICTKHGILLIFDEVIVAWGRLGKPFGSQYFDVVPDMITTAKGITNATIPMGAVLMQQKIYDAFMTGPENAIDLAHGYTYSAHPLACAAGLATLDVYKEEGLLTRAGELAQYWEDKAHALKGIPNIVDIRNIGLIAAFEFAPRPGALPGSRGFDAHLKAFEKGAYVRVSGDIVALAPPLIIQKSEIDTLFQIVEDVLKSVE